MKNLTEEKVLYGFLVDEDDHSEDGIIVFVTLESFYLTNGCIDPDVNKPIYRKIWHIFNDMGYLSCMENGYSTNWDTPEEVMRRVVDIPYLTHNVKFEKTINE